MPIGFALLSENQARPLKSVEEVAEFWANPEVRLWIDLESPSDDDLRRISRLVGLDDESLEDCLHGEPHPQVSEFENYIFLVLYGLYGLKEQADLSPHRLAAFCGKRFLITIVREPLLSVRQIRARCGRHPELFARGVDFVLYEIIDAMVDYYLRVADRYEDRLEALEERSFEDEVGEEVLEQAAAVRRDILELRRLAVAQRQLLLPVAKGEYDFVSETLSQRFSHVCDHLSHVVDSVDALRELIVSIRENYHAALTRRTNDTMKLLTVLTAILMPLTLIAGIYGMNLPLWPPSDHPLSFWGVLATMVLSAAGMLYYFRRRRWL